MGETEAQRRANLKYKSAKVRQVNLKFFPKDQDAYEHLKKQPKMAEYLIRLIRQDMTPE